MRKKIYSQALDNLYEYLDIKNIIKRLQDIDKFKMIFLDNNQREVFDILPKPGIGKQDHRSFFTMESIVKSRKAKYRKASVHRLGFLLNGDPVNKRMYELIHPDLKEECESYKKSPYFFFNVNLRF